MATLGGEFAKQKFPAASLKAIILLLNNQVHFNRSASFQPSGGHAISQRNKGGKIGVF